jgi:chemotaxis protein histidine kinase CheA
MNTNERETKLKDFIAELSGFASDAEKALKEIEADPHGNKGKFDQFSEMMIAIRGTSAQLGFSTIAEMAGLGEELAVKGPAIEKGSMIKKCVAALWDALTTVKYMLENRGADDGLEQSEEQEILKNRLQSTLRILGGPREQVSAADIEKLLRGE